MDSRCYEKNIRSFYQNEVNELLEAWGDAKAVYIYEEKSAKAEYLRSILDKKPLIETVPVHVYHESFEDCKNLRILDDDETDMFYSSSKNLKDCFPVLYFQEKYQEPILYIAVDDASYEKLFPSDSNEAEEAAGSEEAVETDGYDTSRDTDAGGNDNNNQAQNASGAEQATEGGVDARDWQTLTPWEQAEAFKQIFLEYLQLERDNIHHPFFYLPAFRHIMEIHVHFKEAFQIVTGTSLQDFYQQKRYEDLTYQQLLELYVYTDIIERGPYHFQPALVFF